MTCLLPQMSGAGRRGAVVCSVGEGAEMEPVNQQLRWSDAAEGGGREVPTSLTCIWRPLSPTDTSASPPPPTPSPSSNSVFQPLVPSSTAASPFFFLSLSLHPLYFVVHSSKEDSQKGEVGGRQESERARQYVVGRRRAFISGSLHFAWPSPEERRQSDVYVIFSFFLVLFSEGEEPGG